MLSAGWLRLDVLGQVKLEVWAWQGSVLPLCFPVGGLRAMLFCCVLKSVRLFIEPNRKLALSTWEVGEAYFSPPFHDRGLYLEGTLGMARISRLFRKL